MPATKNVKTADKSSKNGKLLKPQLRILTVLSKLKDGHQGLDRKALAEKANVHINWVIEYVGTPEGTPIVRGAEKLLTAKLVSRRIVGGEDTDKPETALYAITPAGRKAVASANGKA